MAALRTLLFGSTKTLTPLERVNLWMLICGVIVAQVDVLLHLEPGSKEKEMPGEMANPTFEERWGVPGWSSVLNFIDDHRSTQRS